MVLSSKYRDDNVSFRKLSNEQLEVKEQIELRLRNGDYDFKKNSCLCGSDNAILLAEKDCFGLPQKVFLCKRCSLIYQDPILSEKTLLSLYEGNFRKLYSTQDLKGVYLQTQINTGRQIIKSMSQFADLKDKYILDIGCGAGGLLIPLNEAGAKTHGIDMDDDYLSIGKEMGLNVINCDLMTFETDRKFDLIIMTDTFEHLPNAGEILSKIKGLLADGGYLFIGVPNIDPCIPKFHFLHHLHILHMWYFDRKTLSDFLESQGFAVKDICVERNLEIISQKQNLSGESCNKRRTLDVIAKYALLKFRGTREALVSKIRKVYDKE